jgi:hypothetical protein
VLLIAFLAIAGMLELVVGRDSPGRAAHDAGGSPYLPFRSLYCPSSAAFYFDNQPNVLDSS